MDVRDHGWFVFFAPHDKPEIAGVIFAEHAEHGYRRRADREVRDGNLFRQEGRRPLPTLPPPARAGAGVGRRGEPAARPPAAAPVTSRAAQQ